MAAENQAVVDRPATARGRSAPLARAMTDGDIVRATVDVAVSPEHVFRALTTDEVERWWGAPGVYAIEAWKAEVRVGGALTVRHQDFGRSKPAREHAGGWERFLDWLSAYRTPEKGEAR